MHCDVEFLACTRGKDYARSVEAHPDTEMVAVWDEVPERGRAEAAKRHVPYFENLDELLAQPNVDAVVVDAPTSMHHEVMVKGGAGGQAYFHREGDRGDPARSGRNLAGGRSGGWQVRRVHAPLATRLDALD